ncbi:hypothetical protein XELAEV_18039752mg [Xenopus laevis]|uniref:Uncharacterized protein n=1 Tax=Xenopus laevis TaxID=8355 RepID=A0A974C986_XENLA|nr:hypothetical protein XELAEV_18039752mg [Xenopus laevis]
MPTKRVIAPQLHSNAWGSCYDLLSTICVFKCNIYFSTIQVKSKLPARQHNLSHIYLSSMVLCETSSHGH